MTEYKIVWNEARTVGIICNDGQLAYELRRGADNPLGIVTSYLMNAWAEFTVDDNCTIETVETVTFPSIVTKLQSSNQSLHYALEEIDAMREAVFWQITRDLDCYNRDEMQRVAEERLRTYILAGLHLADIEPNAPTPCSHTPERY